MRVVVVIIVLVMLMVCMMFWVRMFLNFFMLFVYDVVVCRVCSFMVINILWLKWVMLLLLVFVIVLLIVRMIWLVGFVSLVLVNWRIGFLMFLVWNVLWFVFNLDIGICLFWLFYVECLIKVLCFVVVGVLIVRFVVEKKLIKYNDRSVFLNMFGFMKKLKRNVYV